MSHQNTPRNINLSNARGASNSAGTPNTNGAGAAQRRQMYDQAADTQQPQNAASGQVRRTASPSQLTREQYAAQQQARRQQLAAQQQQQYARNAAVQQGQSRSAPQRAASPTREEMLRAQQQHQAAARQRPVPQGNPQQRAASGQRAATGTQRPAAGTQRAAVPASAQAQRPRGAQPGQPAQRARSTADSAARGTYRSQGAQGTQGGARNSAAAKKRKQQKTLHRALTGMCITFAVLLVCYIGLRAYAGTIITTGEGGTIAKQYKTPPQFSGTQLNVLLIGIDYTAEDGQGRSPNGMTDMIMYVRFDFEQNTIKMLQIPRDTYVGESVSTGGSGKINALYANGDDKEDRVNNLSQVLSEQYQLPVDNYVSIDMDSLRQIIDLFGGIDVYVPMEMEFAGSYIPQGMQHLDGASSEFFLRNRKQFNTSDIQRLSNQRYFYSALFRLLRTSPWQEIVKLVPVVQQYVNTDIDAMDCAGLGIKVLKIPSSQIMLCRLPVYGAAETYNGQSILVAGASETADLLNEYFRTPETQVSVEQLNIAQLPTAGGIYESEVQWMNSIDADGGGTVGEAADATQTGDDVLAEANAASDSLSAGSTPGNAAA